VFVSIKHSQKKEKFMLTLGIEPMQFVSEEYHHHTFGYLQVQQTATLSQHPPVEAQLANHTPRKIYDI